MSKFVQDFWYLCTKSFGCFTKGYWYYCPKNGYLKAGDNNPHRVPGFYYKNFNDGDEIKIKSQ